MTTTRYRGPAGRGGERGSERERPARGCGLRVLRDRGIGAPWSLERSERRCVLGGGVRGPAGPECPGSLGGERAPARGDLPLLHPRPRPPPPQPDETLSERLWGLTEMFPERIRSAAGATFDLSLFVAQKMYRFSRAALWIGTTSFMILVLPVVFETEKLQMEQQQQLQQRQILLGPNTGLSGGMPGALPSLPGKI